MPGRRFGGAGRVERAGRVLVLPVAGVAELVRERYGLRPRRVDRVEAELTTVCRLEDDDGRGYAVKVGRDVEDERAALEWRTDVVVRLAGQGQPVPVVLPDRLGAAVSATESAGIPLLVVVEEWLTGVPLQAADVDRALARDIGRTAARL